MESLSFTPMVQLYDETRTFDLECFAAVLDYIADRFSPDSFSRLFEPGIGTGRIAVPFAERGYRVTGVDISAEMLAVLEGRIRQADGGIAIDNLQADVTELPFADGTFDMAVAIHLFYFIPDWRQAIAEITRVVRTDGPLLLMNTGFGMEIPALNVRYKAFCAELGFECGYRGVATTADILKYLSESGRTLETIRNRWQWVSRISLRTALSYQQRRAYSYSAVVPAAIHEEVMRRLTDECITEYADLDTEIDVPNQIYLTIVKKNS